MTPMGEPLCTCSRGPDFEGPCSWCDVHGQPSAAFAQGYDEGRRHERKLMRLEAPTQPTTSALHGQCPGCGPSLFRRAVFHEGAGTLTLTYCTNCGRQIF